MLPTDDTDWLEDFWIELSEREIVGYASAIGETLVFTRSKLMAATWLLLPGIVGTMLGGVLAGRTIWASWLSVLSYCAVLPAVWWAIRELTRKLLGTAMQWQAVVLFFFTFLMGASVVFGARFTSPWWAYGISGGMGLLLGMVYGSLDPTSIRNKDLWLAVSFLLGPVGTVLATYIHRHTVGSPGILADAIAAGIGGAIFTLPMMALLVRLWDNSRGLRQLGILYLHNDASLATSVDYLTGALTLAPDDVDLLNLRAIAFSRVGDTARAEADWRRVLELDADNVEPLKNRGDALLRKGLVGDAVTALESVAKAHPKHGPTHASLGVAFAETGDFTRAMQHYDRALALESRRPSTYAHRAQARLTLGAFDQAIDDCDQALSLNWSYALPYLIRGHAYASLGDREKAAGDFREALEAAPDQETMDEARRALGGLS